MTMYTSCAPKHVPSSDSPHMNSPKLAHFHSFSFRFSCTSVISHTRPLSFTYITHTHLDSSFSSFSRWPKVHFSSLPPFFHNYFQFHLYLLVKNKINMCCKVVHSWLFLVCMSFSWLVVLSLLFLFHDRQWLEELKSSVLEDVNWGFWFLRSFGLIR